jgi:hypothetical protein
MGDWNTLHIFDDRYFYERLVPDFKDKGEVFKSYMDSLLGKYILWDNSNSEARTRQLVAFCRELTTDFKVHKKYFEIQGRKKMPTEVYAEFISKQIDDDEHFRHTNADAIEDLNRLLTLIIFTECASFNPHLVLGRRIFTGNVDAKAGSIADNIITRITYNELGSPYYGNMSNCNGLTNWITNEDLQLLWLDRNNLYSPPDGSQEYLQEFLAFTELALQHDCGFISVTNVNESTLTMIETSKVKINVDPKEKGWKSVIVFPTLNTD